MFFSDIIGHDDVKKILHNAIVDQRVAHAYLFFGPRGVGKKSLSIAFAAAMLCKDKQGWGCGQCSSCHKILTGNFPDIMRVSIEQGNSIKIDQIRELQKKVKYKPYEGSKKVCIIEDAAALTRDAANALLKILEDPPIDTVFILNAVNQYKVIPTILSRCQAIQVGKVRPELIEKQLHGQGLSMEKARLFASLSNGIPGIALEMASSTAIEERRELVFRALELIRDNDLTKTILFAEELEKREDLQEILEYMMLYYRDSLLWQTTGEKKYITNIDKMEDIQNIKQNKHYLMQAINEIMETKIKLAQNVGTRLAVEVLLLTLSDELGLKLA